MSKNKLNGTNIFNFFFFIIYLSYIYYYFIIKINVSYDIQQVMFF